MSRVTPHSEAARLTLARLREAGHTVTTIADAIERGLLTDLAWCEALDEQREVFGVSQVASEDERREKERQKSHFYYHRRKERQE